MKYYRFYIMSLFLWTTVVSAGYLPEHAAVPGGVAVIELQDKVDIKPQAFYQGHPVLVQNHKNHWVALVGIPLSATPGKSHVIVKTTKRTYEINFSITPKAYQKEHIQLKSKEKVHPRKQDLKRIQKEYQQIINAYNHWSQHDPAKLRFKVPVKGRKSSSFGLRRIFNGVSRNPHSGMDIAAPVGTPVKLPLPGKVLLTGDYFYSGNAVFVDHGSGLVTAYAHLNAIYVKSGDELKEDAVIGEVGKTGRVTGAHLHWSVSLNGVRVDPQLFLSKGITSS